MSLRGKRAAPSIPSPPAAPVRGTATAWLVAGSLVSGLSGYVYQVLGARVLGEDDFAPLGLLWTVQYLVIAVALVPVESWTARQRAAGTRGGATGLAVGVLVGWSLVVAVIVGAVGFAFPQEVLGGEESLVLSLPVAVLSYALFMGLRGVLAGDLEYAQYGRLTTLEGLARVVLVVLAAALWPTTGTFGWVLPLGPVLACAVWFVVVRRARGGRATVAAAGAPPEPIGGPAGDSGAAGFLGWSAAANGLAQTLLLASPLLLVPFGASPSEVAVFFVTMTAARVPLVLAYNGMLSRVLAAMTRAAAQGASLRGVTAQVAGGTVGAAALAALLGALLGPLLLALAFGEDFRPSPWLAALAGAGAVLATGAQIVNQALLAEGRVRRSVLPWAAALGTAALVAALTGPLSASARAASAFVSGELVALLVLAVAVAVGPPSLLRGGDAVGTGTRVVA